jgi:NTE family protein
MPASRSTLRWAALVLLGIQPALAAVPVQPAQAGSDEPAAQRPRIGLVLAGGGAKGGAHVGVLKELERLHIPIDCVAGTSMGALIGAGYASGLPAAEVEKFLLSINWNSVIGDVGGRELEPIEQKRAAVTYTNTMELGLKGGRIVVPGGLVDTARIENLLREYVARARMQSDFDRLPIPFRAVATDMVKGEMVVLKSGDIAAALRASMAIPGAFSPVLLDGRVLADGGMVRNIPVDVARDMCADIVIVSNLVERDVQPENMTSALQLLMRSTDISIISNEREQLATLTDRDVLIGIPMGNITTAAFDRIPETIPLGEAAAVQVAPQLARLSLPEDEYVAWRRRVTEARDITVRVAEVRYEGLKYVNPEYLEARAQIKAGDQVNVAAIGEEATRMSALTDFDTVGYRLAGEEDQTVLEWLPHEKTQAPSYLRFDLGMYTSTGGDLAFVLYGAHTRTWLNRLGGEWHNELQLGYENLLSTRLYQPIDARHRWFVEPRLLAQQTIEDIYFQGDRLSSYDFRDLGGGVDIGFNPSNFAQWRVGYMASRRSYEVDTGSLLFPDGSSTDAGGKVELTYDSRDNRFNATQGLAAMVEYMIADPALGASREWQRLEMAAGAAIPVGKNLVWTTVAAGSDLGTDIPFDRMFTLGGPGSFPGFELGELRTRQYWSMSGSYLYKLTDISPLRGQALYLGMRAQVGRAFEPIDDIPDHEIWGASFYLTGRTPVGPATLGVGLTSRDTWSVWLGVGRPIGHGTLLERGIFR